MTNHVEDPRSAAEGETARATWFLIIGQGRSGSTLLGNLLTDAVAGFNCGELQSLWEGIANDQLCTCGTKLIDCELWSSVVDRIRTEMGFATVDDAIAASRRRTRQRHLLAPRLPEPTAEELALRSATERAVEEVTGATTLIDSSKTPPTMWTAAHLERPLTVVHLIRDPRGVAYSWGKVTPDPSQKSGYMTRKNAWQSAMAWNTINLTTVRLMRRIPDANSVEMRYEDLVQNLGRELPRITRAAGEALTLGSQPPATQDAGDLSHAIGGNPRRFRKEEIRLDTRWWEAMPPLSRLVCTVATLPLLPRFGYLLRRYAASED